MKPILRLLGLAFVSIACSPELHVGEPEPSTVLTDESPDSVAAKSTDRAVSIVEESRPILTFGIDAGDLYWVVITAVRQGETDWQLYRCSLENCAASVESLGTSTLSSSHVSGTRRTMFFDDSAAYFYSDNDYSMPVRCSKHGWQGKAAAPVIDGSGSSIASQGMIYWWIDTTVLRQCLAADCAATQISHYLPQTIDGQGVDWGGSMLEADSEYLYTWWHGRILRYELSGLLPFEVFAYEASVADIAATGDTLYWTEGSSFGAIKSCPKSGCEGEPRILVDGLNAPVTLLVDGSRAYIAERPQYTGWPATDTLIEGTGRVARYSLDDTEEPKTFVQTRDNIGQIQLHGPLAYFLSCASQANPTDIQYVAPGDCRISAVAR